MSNLLLKVQQGLSIRLQHGVQAGAESPQVYPMKSGLARLVGVVLLSDQTEYYR